MFLDKHNFYKGRFSDDVYFLLENFNEEENDSIDDYLEFVSVATGNVVYLRPTDVNEYPLELDEFDSVLLFSDYRSKK